MKRNHLYIAGAVLILAFAGFALASFKETLTPYVSYQQARSVERVVQVAGALEQGSTAFDAEGESLVFTLREEESGDTLRVRYHGVKPGNFEDAISIVAIGRYDEGASEFEADKLLVKCPSKYQGLEEGGPEGGTETKTYG